MNRLLATSRAVLAVAAFCGLFCAMGAERAYAETDELAQMGLPPDKGRDEVEAYCGACHSLKIVAQQGLSRADWVESLQWMVEEQEMDPLEPADYKLVLDYLSKHLSVEATLKKRK